ncbi:unnamed protein product [Schistocephalus solidus]|uniref:C2H2-type domain-containing protein n=1 Tax=Schistocephalus solidus TaxID=70667 RepID=A0A183SYU9_SCHSO|nr:unnamed protein product [Schistocephalus solidus]
MPVLSTHFPRANRTSRRRRTEENNNPTTANVANLRSDLQTVITGTYTPTPTIVGTTSQYFPSDATTTINSDWDSVVTSPHCDCTFTSRIGLVGHLQIHRTGTGEPVSVASNYSRYRHIHCPHCPRAFTHRMGLFGHMHIHDSGIQHAVDSADTRSTPLLPQSQPQQQHFPHYKQSDPLETSTLC